MTWDEQIVKNMEDNFFVFLNSSIEALNRGMGEYGNAILATVNIQLALELLLKLAVCKKEGINVILNTKQAALTDEEKEKLYRANKLKFRDYSDVKNHIKANRKKYWLNTDEFDLLDKFLDYRNKILHGSYAFSMDELEQNSMFIVHILAYVINTLFSYERGITDGTKQVVQRINVEAYNRLLNYPGYEEEMYDFFADIGYELYVCPSCRKRMFVEDENICLACFEDYSDDVECDAIGYLECPKCKRNALMYDKLNIEINKSIMSKCINCGENFDVFRNAENCRDEILSSEGNL